MCLVQSVDALSRQGFQARVEGRGGGRDPGDPHLFGNACPTLIDRGSVREKSEMTLATSRVVEVLD
jgi:hypothetical protein